MLDLLVKSITGQVEMLTDSEVVRKAAVNGDKYISVQIVQTETNKLSFPLVQNENILIYDEEEYVIKQHKETTLGLVNKIECTAILKFFDELKNNRVYETETGTKRLDDLMNFALSSSGYTYSIISDELPLSIEVENFGDENSLALFKEILEKFGAEFEVINKHITVKKRIGTTTDNQFRYMYNISNPSKDIDTSSFATYIRGYGKQNEDGSYMAQVEYTSPLAEIYGIKHAQPVRDERFENENTLLEECIRTLNDNIDMSIQLTYVQLQEYGIQDVQLGDYVWCILDPFDIDIRIRVIEKEDYSNSNKAPVFTLGTVTKKATDIIASFNTTKSTVEKLTQPGGVKFSYLDDTIKRYTYALQSTQTELEFSNGIIARDKENSNKLVLFNSAGLGISDDGGISFKSALTGEGLVADVITAGTLRSILVEGVEVRGSTIISVSDTTGDSTEITGGKVQATGSFTRDFDTGQTATYVSTFDSYNGAVRIGINSKKGSDGIERVLTGGRALIYTDKTISSQRAIHSGSVDKKGARFIDFFADETLTSDVQGLGFHFYSGQGMTLESHQGMEIRSDTSYINLRPEYDNQGNNAFSFQIVDSEILANNDGLLYYGSTENGFTSGLRFTKNSENAVYVTDGTGTDGTGDLRARQVFATTLQRNSSVDGAMNIYVKPAAGGELRVTQENTLDSYVDFRARQLFANTIQYNNEASGINIYIKPSATGEVRVTAANTTDSYVPMRASEFRNGSSLEYKTNIEPLETSGLYVINKLQPQQYYLQVDLDQGNYSNQQVGFISELSPEIATQDQKAVNLYKTIVYNVKATQEVDEKVETNISRLGDHELVITAFQNDLAATKTELTATKDRVKKLEERMSLISIKLL